MNRKSFCIIDGKKYKYFAPDGGWGYMICVAVSLNMVVSMSFMPCFAILFNDFLKDRGINSTSVTMLNAINCICLSISGFATGRLLKKTTLRRLGCASTVIIALGLLANVFVRSFTELVIAQALQCTGLGFMINLKYSILNDYFFKKRLFVFSLTKTIMGIAWMISPLFTKWSMEFYGFRGTQLLILGINMNLFVGIALMQPIKWHRKMVEVDAEEESGKELEEQVKECNNTSITDSYKGTVYLETAEHIKNDKGTKSEESLSLMNETDKFIVKPYKTENKAQFGSLEKGINYERNDSEEAKEIVKYVKRLSINNFPLDQIPVQKNGVTWKSIVEVMELSLFKDLRFLNTCLCMSFAFFADNNYGLLFPLAMYSYGWDGYQVAFSLSLYAVGDIVIKLVFVATSQFIQFDNRKLFLIGLLIGLFTRLGIQWNSNFTAVLVMFCLMGISRSFFQILLPIIIADMVETKVFSSAHGLVMLTFGFVNVVFAPVIGAVRDLSNSYAVTFLVLTGCFGIVSILWGADLYYYGKKHKNKNRR